MSEDAAFPAALDLAAIRARHRLDGFALYSRFRDTDVDACRTCREPWPCDVGKLLARIEHDAATLARYRALLDAVLTVVDKHAFGWQECSQCADAVKQGVAALAELAVVGGG